MTDRGNKIAKLAVAVVTVPLLLWAYEFGPDPGYSGVPNENGGASGASCANATCHVGTANTSRGSVTAAFANGASYVPGVKQHVSVTIADPDTTQRLWGFQLTARLASNTGTMAGAFTSTDGFTTLICSQANLRVFSELKFGASQTCPASSPLQYIEHSDLGTAIPARVATGSLTYEFDWTPPATNVGNITIFLAGNAANGDRTNTGDHIYTRQITLTATTAGPTPSISAVEHGASFTAGIAPGTFIQIKGANLANTTNLWDNAVVNNKVPTTLDGVTVSVGGKAAYVRYVSPTQINVLTPPDIGTGSMQVVVTNSGTNSAGFTTNSNSVAPAFFLWNQYAVASHYPSFDWAVKNGTFQGVTTTPAKPGEVIILWGTGFGPTNPSVPAGTLTPGDQAYSTASPVTVTVGGTQATVFGTALTATFAGLYQVAIQVPDNAPNGDLPVVASINGASSPITTLLTVQK